MSINHNQQFSVDKTIHEQVNKYNKYEVSVIHAEASITKHVSYICT